MKYRFCLLLTIAGFFAACSGNNKPVDITASAAKETASKYKLGNVTEKALSSTARLPGQLNPYNEVNIFPKVNGFVKTLFVDRGSIVSKGQLLAVLEAPEMESQLQAANSRYLQAQENARASTEKYQRLKQAASEPGSVSPLDLNNASAKPLTTIPKLKKELKKGTAIIGFALKYTLGLRPSAEQEEAGLNVSDHGEEGYIL